MRTLMTCPARVLASALLISKGVTVQITLVTVGPTAMIAKVQSHGIASSVTITPMLMSSGGASAMITGTDTKRVTTTAVRVILAALVATTQARTLALSAPSMLKPICLPSDTMDPLFSRMTPNASAIRNGVEMTAPSTLAYAFLFAMVALVLTRTSASSVERELFSFRTAAMYVTVLQADSDSIVSILSNLATLPARHVKISIPKMEFLPSRVVILVSWVTTC